MTRGVAFMLLMCCKLNLNQSDKVRSTVLHSLALSDFHLFLRCSSHAASDSGQRSDALEWRLAN